jgi:pyruvate dehydrogenase E2 component (dihydrolipoamide acetyltransferase)
VDIRLVRGTGPGGRVERQDVEEAVHGGEAPAAQPRPARAPSIPEGGEERVPFRGLRKKIAEHMTLSKSRAAHFSYMDEVDCSRLMELHERLQERAVEKGVRLTPLAYFLKAAALALQEHRALNASVDDEAGEIVYHGHVSIGIAVDSEQGLIVPVVKGADRMSVFEIAAEIRRVAEDARAGRSQLQDLQGSTFTITSVGNIGGLFATPILNYPEVAILGVNKIHERPVVREGHVVIRKMVYLSVSLDHRAVDGADGARFMNTLKGLLEEPALLFVDG